jgi:hypothetical protein
MKVDADRQDAVRFWALGALAVFLSAGAAFSYLHSMGYGITAGDLIGLRGRGADVAYDQRWAVGWLMTAFRCLGVSSLSGALATSMYKEAAWLPRFVARLVVALVISFVLAVLIGFVYFSIVAASHRLVVH